MARLSALVLLAVLCGLSAAALPQTTTHCGTDDVVSIRETQIDGYVDALMGPRWLTTQVVYVRSIVHDSSSDVQSVIYRSEDSGKTWTDEMQKLKNSEDGVYEVVPTATDGKAWITGFGKFLWVTTDAGASYQTVNIPSSEVMVGELYPHPYLSDYAMITTQSSGKNGEYYASLFVTTNFGQDWTLVDTYVSVPQWAVEGLTGGSWVTNHTIIWTAVNHASRSGYQTFDLRNYAVYHTENLGEKQTLIRDHTPGMLVHADVFFIAGWESDPKSPLALYVSMNGGDKFTQCVFPHDEILSELNYIILEANYGSAFVFVLHSQKNSWGNVYMSDSFDTSFSLTLPFAVAYQKNGYGAAFPEWMSVSRLPGIYIANVWDVGTSPGPSTNTPIVTRTTRDNGGSWAPLAPPQGSSCGGSKTCSLQLRGPRTSNYGAFYSDPDAIGLVVANGNVGASLDLASSNPTTFVSRDAALSWFSVADVGLGNKTFEWADHGALFLAASTGLATNQVHYSILEGEQFIECNYTGDDIKVKRTLVDIYNDPKMETASFLAGATKSDGKWVLLFFDFRNVFRRTCVGYDAPGTPDSDYEIWYPTYAEGDGPDCVLGQQQGFIRRKQFAQCFNGEGYEVLTNLSSCPCTVADFQCTSCYTQVVNASGTFCVLACDKAPNAPKPPVPCHGTYFYAPGWEKIPLDMCEGTPPGIGRMVQCPGFDTTHTLLIVILLFVGLIFVIVGGCWALAKYNPAVREFWSRTVPGIIAPTFGRSNSSSATYSLLKKPDSMDDDDEEALAEGSQAKELDDDTILNYSKDKDNKEKKDTKEAEIL